MSQDTIIQWADSTVNPVMGCDGCELWNHLALADPKAVRKCYAGVLTSRYAGQSPGYPASFKDVTLFPGRMAAAARWKDLRGVARAGKPWVPPQYPRLVFISDMGDALSRAVSFEYLEREVVSVAREWPHVGLWLTKQPKRMAEFSRWLAAQGKSWPQSLWVGTSVTSPDKLHRLRELARVGDATTRRFISFEPMLGWSGLSVGQLRKFLDQEFAVPAQVFHWAITGFESGHVHGPNCAKCDLPEAEPGEVEVLAAMNDLFQRLNIAVFVKQLGSRPLHLGMPLRLKDKKGGDWKEWPDVDFNPRLRIRQLPKFF